MKRLYIALVVFAVVVSSVAVVSAVSEKKLEETSDAFLICVKKEKNENLDSLKIREAVKVWEKNKRFLLLFTFHSDFAELEEKITKLRFYADHPDFEKSSKISYETGEMLTSLAQDFYVSLENIF